MKVKFQLYGDGWFSREEHPVRVCGSSLVKLFKIPEDIRTIWIHASRKDKKPEHSYQVKLDFDDGVLIVSDATFCKRFIILSALFEYVENHFGTDPFYVWVEYERGI
jgi:hypothetical protein